MNSKNTDKELPVFYDKSGKRWRYVKIIALFLTCCTAAFIAWIVPQLLADRQVAFFEGGVQATYVTAEPVTTKFVSVPDVSAILDGKNTPVIGAGPLVRVVMVSDRGGEQIASDPFTGRVYGTLTPDQRAYVDGERFAIQRYGETHSKRVALTFDDGPDPVYTPELLDVLSREHVQASFFVIGDNVVKYPEIVQRIVREGHTIANHTFSHTDLDLVSPSVAEQEINQTGRLIAATSSRATSFFRPPYAGENDQTLRNDIQTILTSQKLGYLTTYHTFDSGDWQFTSNNGFTFPTFDGDTDQIVLMHDSGGNRSHTISYVKQVIARAKAKGFTFTGLDGLYHQSPSLAMASPATAADYTTYGAAWMLRVLPRWAVSCVFVISLILIPLAIVLNIFLAIVYRRTTRYAPRSPYYHPFVSIVVPAYNESVVLRNTIRSLAASAYSRIEIIIVDDGSTDDTLEVAHEIAGRYPNVHVIHQENGGKASAINHAVDKAKGSIVVGVDADTTFMPGTVDNLVRHFQDKDVAAVAGEVRVGNVHGMLTLWQALEYTLSINIERSAHAMLGSIMVVPGACGAWRKSVIARVGGLSHGTLAEDCELTLKIQRLGVYKILQDNEAISYTEAPEELHSLIKQRFRWTFGSIQALWKHHGMIFNERYRFLGVFIMPYTAITVMLPLVFWPLLMLVGLQNILAGNYVVIAVYFMVVLMVQFIVAAIGIWLGHAPKKYLLAVPFARFIYGPIRMYVLYKTVMVALRGSHVGWNKLARTGAVAENELPIPAPSRATRSV